MIQDSSGSFSAKSTLMEAPIPGNRNDNKSDKEKVGGDATQGQVATDPKPTGAASEKYIVDWDGPDDVANPLNWVMKRKSKNMGIISLLNLITPLASSMFAPGVPQLMEDFHNSNPELASFVVSVYILGFAIGPMLIAPLSELYGRRIVYISCSLLFTIFIIICGESQNIGMFVVFRFLAGCAGVAPLANGGGSIGDLMVPETRGAAMAVFGLGPLLGPIIGPIAGGYLVEASNWRWVFRALAIAAGVLTLVSFFLEETYAPILLSRKAKALCRGTGDHSYQSKYVHMELRPHQIFEHAIIRPLKLLFCSPIVFLLSLHMGMIYGYLYLLFTTFTVVFEGQYHFSTGTAGLSFLGLGVGSLVGVVVLGIMSDKIFVSLKRKNGGEGKPEYRLPLMVVCCLFTPVGLFWYGWSADKKVHWIVPIIGTLFVAIGMLSVMLPVQNYLIDAYTQYAASAIAACTIFRSVLGGLLPLAGQPMYNALGIGWGNSLLGFLALAFSPVPWIFLRFGEKIRERAPLNLD